MSKHVSTTLAQLARDFAIIKRQNATAKVDEAIREGRLAPEQRAWGIEYATTRPNAFATFLGAAPLLDRNADGTFTARPANGLSRTERMVAQKMGITAEQFAQAKAKRTQAQ